MNRREGLMGDGSMMDRNMSRLGRTSEGLRDNDDLDENWKDRGD